MKEILITSSVLILALLLIRKLFHNFISARLQYALWGLVLLRLLIPVSLPAWNFSILTAAAPIEEAVGRQVTSYFQPDFQSGQDTKTPGITAIDLTQTDNRNADNISNPADPGSNADNILNNHGSDTNNAGTDLNTGTLENTKSNNIIPETIKSFLYGYNTIGSPADAASANRTPVDKTAYLADLFWKIGMLAAALFFLITNVAFWLKVRNCRVPFHDDSFLYHLPFNTKRKIYILPDGILSSPCLFCNAIYLTPQALRSETSLRHVLCHEEMHAKHLDSLWSCLKALCMIIYWFDPLVWLAAYYSRIDCELACDESALEYLGESERISYGKTLLSLISVKTAENPFLSATTMTSGHKQLKNRISRIANQQKSAITTVAAVLVLAAVTSACTFSKGLNPGQDNSQLQDALLSESGNGISETQNGASGSPDGQTGETGSPANMEGLTALTGEELQWFNNEFFNANGDAFCMANQFANPYFFYDKPEDINLFEMFYSGVEIANDPENTGWEMVTGEELHEVLDTELDADELPCPLTKVSASALNDCFRKYTGLNIDETDRIGLGDFIYSDQYDAYYIARGDTNYSGTLFFHCGTKQETENGALIKLYHYDGIFWNCVTLRENTAAEQNAQESPYLFVSNKQCGHPAIPTPMPNTNSLSVSLLLLEPYTAGTTAAIEHRPASDFDGNYENRLSNWNFDGRLIGAYRDAEGKVRVGERLADGSYNIILTAEDAPMHCIGFFNDLFCGCSGFYVDYYAPKEGSPNSSLSPCRAYYTFGPIISTDVRERNSDNDPVGGHVIDNNNSEITPLCRIWTQTSGTPFQIDLDGDGKDELIGDYEIFFERDEQIFRADIPELIRSKCPENIMLFAGDPRIYQSEMEVSETPIPEIFTWIGADWDVNGKYLELFGFVRNNEGGEHECRRQVYFDGVNLKIY